MYGAGSEPEFEIVSERPKTFGNFPIRGREITIRSLAKTISDPEEYVNNLFQFVLDHVLQGVDPDSKVGFKIES